MRIGLTGGASSIERIIEQARQAEADGFTSLWYASQVAGDPIAPMAIAGRETSRIELGTGVLQTYPCHPLLQANRALSAVAGMNRPGFTLGIGPSHEPLISGMYGLSYQHPGRNTEEYLRILTAALRGEALDVDGQDWSAHTPTPPVPPSGQVPVLLAALGPRLLRVAGELADGTILWMAPPKAVETHVVPRITAAAASAGRPAPRIVAGLPIAVHDDQAAARGAAAKTSTIYAGLPNYQRILDIGGAASPADAAIVGTEVSVRKQLHGLVDAGATDIWAFIVPVGQDREERKASVRRTTDLLRELVS